MSQDLTGALRDAEGRARADAPDVEAHPADPQPDPATWSLADVDDLPSGRLRRLADANRALAHYVGQALYGVGAVGVAVVLVGAMVTGVIVYVHWLVRIIARTFGS